MEAVRYVVAFLGLPVVALASTSPEMLARIPLHFEPNHGQAPAPAQFIARGGGLTLYIGPASAAMIAHRDRIEIKLDGARPATLEGADRQPGVSHYYPGNDPSQWRTSVPHFARAIARNVYHGIDLVYHGNAGRVEYDFVVAPGADPSAIRIAYEGAREIHVDRNGDLVLTARTGEFRQRKPRVYQEIAGRRVEIEASYRLRGSKVEFALARHDRSRPLVIDPVLSYATFLGGAGNDRATGIGTDAAGNIYIGGDSETTGNAADAFVTKLSPDGRTLLFTTYIGGSGNEASGGMAVQPSGSVYLTGTTYSSNLPVANAFQANASAAPEAFAVKLNANGTVAYSTYLGGSGDDRANAIAVDTAGAAYIAGRTSSANFPGGGTSGVATGAFVSKLAPSGSALAFTYLFLGEHFAEARGIAVDATGAYFAGVTDSFNFAGGIRFGPHTTPGGSIGYDGFIAKLALDGSNLIYAAYIGGSRGDEPNAIAVDPAGNAYVTGWTESDDFPVQTAAFGTRASSPLDSYFPVRDAFVAKLDAAGSAIAYSTYLGGIGEDSGSAIAVDAQGRATVAGKTTSPDFPTAAAPQPELLNAQPAFVARLRADGAALEYSTFLHGGDTAEARAVSLDAAGAAWIAGELRCCSGPGLAASGGYDPSYNGGADAFAAKLADGPAPVAVTIATSPAGGSVRVDGRVVTAPFTFLWQPGTAHSLDANVAQSGNLAGLGFSSWSQGGSAAQTIATPGSAQTLTASYGSGICAYSTSPATVFAGFEGGSFSIGVNTSASCVWNASSAASWISIAPFGNRTGSGSFSLGVARNTGPTRTGTFSVAGVTVAVTQEGGSPTSSVGQPTMTAPASGASFLDQRVIALSWTPVAGASEYDVRVAGATTVFRGSLKGANSTTLSIDGLSGPLTAFVRACDPSGCGAFASAAFTSSYSSTFGAFSISAPAEGQVLTASTNEFRWTASSGASRYRVKIRAVGLSTPEMQIFTPTLSTIYSLQGFGDYVLEVSPCTDFVCGTPAMRSFRTNLPPVPTVPPSITGATALSGNSYRFNWTAVAGADIYRIQVVQPNAGPGGGALTVASTQTAIANVTLTVPAGGASAFVAACNGRGCGPYSAGFAIGPPGPSSAAPVLGQPISVINVAGPAVLFTWSRVPGDNGSNTVYRLYAQDLSRNGPALDVQTTNNFHAALFAAEGRRYDALVVANPGPSQVVGPPVGFIVQGVSSQSPTPTAPTHESTVRQGNVQVGWTPVEGAALYHYAVFRVGDAVPVAEGVTPGLLTSAPLTAQGGATRYSAIMRACPQASSAVCRLGSDAGWGPWSNAPGGPGVSNFTVTP